MQSNPLDGLHDVIAPEQVSWWPLAPIWWLLIAVIVCAIIFGGYKFYQAKKFKRAKKQAIELSQVCDDAGQLHIILKRLTRHYYQQHLTSAPLAQWSITLSNLTDIRFSDTELMSLYSETDNPKLKEKLKTAITQFKLKEPMNV